ncbi:hypothetical protein [Curtobacterium sp. PhB136]|uniref:hypothetical protein n=1 Tax=Curtobacterium sp. PhB136 TaxID=2485181 RepID=UPI0010498C92|nr:hypothetical protein [Curtobacterium sp. PhB136]TCK63124.1 hypothetical protein EDF27_2790 [Curtobacterium sp. PhB136]
MPLRQWRLLPEGMLIRELVALKKATAEHLAWEAAEAARRAAEEAARQARRDQIVAARERDHDAWLTGTERAAALSVLGEWPAWLTGEDPKGARVSGERWRWFLWFEVIRPLTADENVRSDDVLANLVERFGSAVGPVTPTPVPGSLREAVIAMLNAMKRTSLVSRHEQKRYGKKHFWFTRGSVHEPLTPDQQAEITRQASEREAALRDQRAAGRSTQGADYRRGPGSSAGGGYRRSFSGPPSTSSAPQARKPGEGICSRCGVPVAAFLVEQGLLAHPVCMR